MKKKMLFGVQGRFTEGTEDEESFIPPCWTFSEVGKWRALIFEGSPGLGWDLEFFLARGSRWDRVMCLTYEGNIPEMLAVEKTVRSELSAQLQALNSCAETLALVEITARRARKVEVRRVGAMDKLTPSGVKVVDAYAVFVDGKERQPWLMKGAALSEAKKLGVKLSAGGAL